MSEGIAVNVEIWSDIACPWCYVGKRRFQAALTAFEHRDEVTVTWRSFELDPGAPAELPGDRDEHLARKYRIGIDQARRMHAEMTALGAGEGIGFHFDIARSANTFDAHRLTHLAAAHDLQGELEERLMRAHFSEGELVSDHAVLRRLAEDVGLPGEEAAAVLADGDYADDVREDEATAHSLGITGVPFFAVDRAVGVSGAQPADVLGELLRRGWEARELTLVGAGAGAAACGPDGC